MSKFDYQYINFGPLRYNSCVLLRLSEVVELSYRFLLYTNFPLVLA